jgi:hypothetical protein
MSAIEKLRSARSALQGVEVHDPEEVLRAASPHWWSQAREYLLDTMDPDCWDDPIRPSVVDAWIDRAIASAERTEAEYPAQSMKKP